MSKKKGRRRPQKTEQQKQAEQERLDKNRKQQSLQSMYFNRFLVVRYMLAIFVFANFAWCYLSWGELGGYIGLAMLILAALPMFEMGRMHAKTNGSFKWTWLYFNLQWLLNLILCVLVWVAPMKYSFSFLTDIILARGIGFGISLIGLIMATIVNIRLRKIDMRTDKQLERIRFFENKYRIRA